MNRRLVTLTGCVAVLLAAVACSSDSPVDGSHDRSGDRRGTQAPRRQLDAGLQGASPRDLLVGTAVQGELLRSEPRYARAVRREFGIVTPENDMKWGPIHPARNRYDFRAADAIVSFAGSHGLAVRGHNLAWYVQNPEWLNQGRFTRDEMLVILRDHIRTVVGRYRGRVAQWDVVNEAVADDGSGLRPNIWLDRIGPTYIDVAFRAAHAADPRAKLFYNDFLTEQPGPKADAVYRLVGSMKARGVPIDGVGFQVHTDLPGPTTAELAGQLARYGRLGLDTAVTELDVRVPVPLRPSSVASQARAYGQVLEACLHEPSCHTFVMWGFTDRHSWIPTFFKGFGAATVLDGEYRPKPAHATLRRELQRGR